MVIIPHTILMQSKDGKHQATYNDVVSYQGLYGCLIELTMSDGNTASFDKDQWDMYDLTPTKGWNSRAVALPSLVEAAD